MGSQVTEQVMGAGTWTVDLGDSDGPWRSRLDPLVADAGYATLVVLPSRPPWHPVARQVTNLDTIFRSAVYLGMLTTADDSTLRGEGIAAWMGRPNGIGPRVYAAGGVSSTSYVSMLQLVRDMLGDNVFTPPPQTLRVEAPTQPSWWAAAGGGVFRAERRMDRTYRGDLDEFVRWAGGRYAASFPLTLNAQELVEWRVVPWSTGAAVPGAFGVVVDERRTIYSAWRLAGSGAPLWVVSDDLDPGDPFVVRAELDITTSVEDYATRWWTNPAQQGTAQFGDATRPTNYRHWSDGSAAVMIASGDETVPPAPAALNANDIAVSRIATAVASSTITARCDGRALPWRVPVGADVALDSRLVSTAATGVAPRWVSGRQILPVGRRIEQATWGIPSGAGVYLVLSANGAASGDGYSLVDLSDAFVPDDQPVAATLGEPRKLPDYLS